MNLKVTLLAAALATATNFTLVSNAEARPNGGGQRFVSHGGHYARHYYNGGGYSGFGRPDHHQFQRYDNPYRFGGGRPGQDSIQRSQRAPRASQTGMQSVRSVEQAPAVTLPQPAPAPQKSQPVGRVLRHSLQDAGGSLIKSGVSALGKAIGGFFGF